MMAHDAVESRAAAIQLQPTAQCRLFDFFFDLWIRNLQKDSFKGDFVSNRKNS